MKQVFHKQQMGLSLVELMVAMLISLILLGGVLQVFLSSKDMYRTNTAVARVQEAGRFATEFIAFDVRQAGYKGECLSEPLNHLKISTLSTGLRNNYSITPAIQGWDNSKPPYFSNTERALLNTDSFIVKYAGEGKEFDAQGTNNAQSPSLGVTVISSDAKGTSAYAGQLVLLGNSTGCDIFQNANNTNASTFQRAGGNVSPGNNTPGANWSQSYQNKLSSYIFRSHTYYIRNNETGLPSLARRVPTPTDPSKDFTTEQLVEGIIEMQVTYGIDKDGDRLADEYVKAGTNNLIVSGSGDWNKVVSARISIIAISPEINVLPEPQTFIFPAIVGIDRDDEYATYGDDGTVTIKNNRVAQVYTATVAIRNRLP